MGITIVKPLMVDCASMSLFPLTGKRVLTHAYVSHASRQTMTQVQRE
jgi:hypothetical protein